MYVEVISHQLAQRCGDGESEARAIILARGAVISLLKGLEDDGLSVLGYADARIDNVDT